MIVKSDFTKRCTWSWWVKGDFAWIDKDKREYRTKAQAERCVEVAMESIHWITPKMRFLDIQMSYFITRD